MISYPFISKITSDNPYGDRAITDEMERKINAARWSNGVCMLSPQGDDLLVAAGTGLSVIVKPGGCIICGATGVEDSERHISLAAAHSSLRRIDRIVARFDLSDSVRSIELYKKEGTPSTTPVAPELVRASNYYEIALADVMIKAGATSITNADILDQRQNRAVCGFVIPAFPANFDLSAIAARYTELLESALTSTAAGSLQASLSALEKQAKAAVIKKSNVTMSASGAKADDTFPGYPYVVSIPVLGCSEAYIPDLYPRPEDAALFGPVCETVSGHVRVWVTRNDFSTIAIPSIKLTKEVAL